MSDISPPGCSMIGDSTPIRAVRELIAMVAPTPLCVMIQGETGTGKELAARAIHDASKRTGAFVAVNMCAISDSMFEDDLFGHVRGAFTGAIGDRTGYLGEANGGTIFLDEVSGLSLQAQGKLLRALETQRYRGVGAKADRWSDFRVVAASNQPIESLVAQDRFRGDLAFRLRGVDVWMPPLRERRADIEVLAKYFAATSNHERGMEAGLCDEAVEALEAYGWPGNVRELRQVVARAVAFAKGGRVDLSHVNRAWPASAPRAAFAEIVVREHGDFSRRRLTELLERHAWDTLAAADELAVTRKTIYMRLRRLGIAIPHRYQRRGVTRVRVASPREEKIYRINRIRGESGESSR